MSFKLNLGKYVFVYSVINVDYGLEDIQSNERKFICILMQQIAKELPDYSSIGSMKFFTEADVKYSHP